MGEVYELLRPFQVILLPSHPEILQFRVNHICEMFATL